MISIIICSRFSDVSTDLKENIQSTIGIEYELIVIDNSEKKYSIFQAYNEGVIRAKYPYLCFMHDDILFHKTDWGKKTVAHLENHEIGLIGIAGSHYVPRLPGAHWSSGISSCHIHHKIEGKTYVESYRYTDNHDSSLKAVIVDGLWMCTSKKVMERIRFDEITFSGFHCYDSDISLQILKLNYEVRIVFDIDIEHFSLGIRNKVWLENLFIFFKKWENELPISVFELTEFKKSEANYTNAREIIGLMRINKIGFTNFLKFWLYYIKINPPFNKANFLYSLSLLKRTII